jgi:hypothetical protein
MVFSQVERRRGYVLGEARAGGKGAGLFILQHSIKKGDAIYQISCMFAAGWGET